MWICAVLSTLSDEHGRWSAGIRGHVPSTFCQAIICVWPSLPISSWHDLTHDLIHMGTVPLINCATEQPYDYSWFSFTAERLCTITEACSEMEPGQWNYDPTRGLLTQDPHRPGNTANLHGLVNIIYSSSLAAWMGKATLKSNQINQSQCQFM